MHRSLARQTDGAESYRCVPVYPFRKSNGAHGYIGAYSSWFSTHAHEDASNPAAPDLLLTVLTYVVSALTDPALSLSAATALRNLCEANRKALAAHIGAFGELHAGLSNIPVRCLRLCCYLHKELIYRTFCGCIGLGEEQGAAVDCERYTSHAAQRGDTRHRSAYDFCYCCYFC